MLSEKSRLVIAVEGTPICIRVVPHKEGGDKLTLKCEHPEGVAMLYGLCGLDTVTAPPPVQGRFFFVTTVCRSEFLGLLPVIAGKILDQTVATAEPPPPEEAGVEDEPDGEMQEELDLGAKPS